MDSAEVPERKAFPPRMLIIIFCTFLGFCGASAKVIFDKWWETAHPSHPWKIALQPLVYWRAMMFMSDYEVE
jgi:hypothetical protein